MIVGGISLGSVAGLKSVANEISCVYDTAAAALGVVAENVGVSQNLQLSWSACSARSSAVPGEPLGPTQHRFFQI
jgi:hypothetical protein